MPADPSAPPPTPPPGSAPLRVGVVGAGMWCRAAHLPWLASQPDIELTSVASAHRESAQKIADEFGIQRARTTWAELLQDPLDVVLITAPARVHAEIARAAFARGLHVFCEAPLAMSSAEARAMLDAAERAGRRHAYGLPRPFLYGGSRVAELLRGGALGTPTSATLSVRGNAWLLADPAKQWRARRDAVPPLLVGVTSGVLGPLFGPVKRVCARLERLSAPAGDGHHAPADDYFAALFEYDSGLRATIDAGVSPAPVPGSGLCVFGSDGMLVWDWTSPGSIALVRADGTREDHSVELPAALPDQYPFLREFLRSLRGDGTARDLPDFTFGLNELLVIEACEASARGAAWVEVERA